MMMRFRTVVAALSVFLLLSFGALAQEADCLKCHAKKLKSGKVVHAAMDMGCATCHSGIDARKVPHKKTNTLAKGLTSEQPDLCYGCHDKTLFEKKNVHAAVGMGCTGCHNPHSSGNAKLLIAEPSALCVTCHDKTEFTRKVVHAPVAGGMCLSCHTPHASDETALLVKKPVEVCLECHPDVVTNPHATGGFSQKGHPLGVPKKSKKKSAEPPKDLLDPARPGKAFYCGSCHNPHSSEAQLLFRYGASAMALCQQCHKK